MNSIEIKAPNIFENTTKYPSVFLAGSIEMGVAEPWQEELVRIFSKNVVFYNPRRVDWDSTWDHDSDQFNEQVNWELDMLEESDIIVMYFDPATKSPITLLELGLFANSRKLLVCCPDGFWRKGNVRVVCERNKIQLYNDKESWMRAIGTELSAFEMID